jgi:ATPase subunit of ABC transporter with duplicated ATPase domains
MATTRKSSAKKAVEKPIVSRRSTRYKEPVTPTKPNQSAATEGKVSSSSPKKAITKKRTSKKTAAKKKNANEVVYLEEGDVVPVLQKPVFETFTADIMLNEGLSIIRDIGGGKYEIMNLSAVDFTKLGSEEVGLQIKTNPGRFSMVTGLDVEKWDSAREKCLHAARSASRFRIPLKTGAWLT